MTRPEALCAVPDCLIRGRHTDDGCDTTRCTGCLPGLAADGLLICTHHHRNGIRDLQQLPQLDVDLGRALVPVTSGVKAFSASHGDSDAVGIDLDVHVFEARDYLRNVLANLAAAVVRERGFQPPPGDVPSMVAFLIRNTDWMSAHRHLAPLWTRQASNLRQEARRRAYRSRQTAIKLGICPMTKDDGSVCAEVVRHDPSDYAGQNITCRGCGTTNTLDWWQAAIWSDDTTQLLTADAVAALLTTRYNRVVPPSTVRAWASKGFFGKQDAAGRTVFDIAEVRAHADTVWDPITQEAS